MAYRTQKFELVVTLPDGCSANEMRKYMREAIEQWAGQFHPDDTLFGWFYGDGPKYAPRHLTIKTVKAE